MAGIERIHIIDEVRGRGSWRFKFSEDRWSSANELYRAVFSRLGMPLLSEDVTIQCTQEEFFSGYDHALGIDVLLRFENGMMATVQEKFLSYKTSTVTVEYMQNPATEEQGDWFKLNCQYYFVGYDRTKNCKFDDWILCDWPAIVRATLQDRIHWRHNQNRHDGARASFKYVSFDSIPSECAIARYHPVRKQRRPNRRLVLDMLLPLLRISTP